MIDDDSIIAEQQILAKRVRGDKLPGRAWLFIAHFGFGFVMVLPQGSIRRPLRFSNSEPYGSGQNSSALKTASFATLAGACICVLLGAALLNQVIWSQPDLLSQIISVRLTSWCTNQRGDESIAVSLKNKGFSIGGLTNDLEKATKMFDEVQPVPASSRSRTSGVAPKEVR